MPLSILWKIVNQDNKLFMTKAIIQARHSGSVNVIITLFNLVSTITILPFVIFSGQIITKENLFIQFYTGNKACQCRHAIIFPEFCLAYSLAGV